MADWGIKVSKSGFDVKTCADDELIMSSKLNTFKVSAVGSSSTTYSHGLSYTPCFVTSEYVSSGKYGLIGFFYSTVVTANATQLDFTGATYKYYVFYHGAT